MSLLLEALKKAEKAKEEAQKRAREGEAESPGELRLADDAPPAPAAEERRVVTRDELPQITGPLEIQSEDIAAARAAEPAPQSAPRPAAAARPRTDPQAAQRAVARKPFEAKMREPNPRLPFYITVGVLGAFAVGTVIYFWIQLRPPQSLYVKDVKPPSGETVVAAVSPAPQAGPRLESIPAGALPGLPVASAPATEAAQPAAQPAPPPAVRKPAAAAARPRTAEQPRAAPKPRPSVRPAEEAAPSARPARAAVTATRPQARIHPLVASGYEAYQAGDMERARRDYDSALADEPGNRDALLGLAAVETRAQRFAAADSLYRRVLQIDPRDAHAQA
ncbi:MAG: hypothetical protein OEW94_02730, partial [Betaproteobacteria bacterium]|nr:hypothetical protein [Betaproteobacteria bacterium]